MLVQPQFDTKSRRHHDACPFPCQMHKPQASQLRKSSLVQRCSLILELPVCSTTLRVVDSRVGDSCYFSRHPNS
jgi:hypothetical protein